MIGNPSNTQGTSQQCGICGQYTSKIDELIFYDGKTVNVCQQCQDEDRVTVCLNEEEAHCRRIVAHYTQPSPDAVDCQRDGNRMWLCPGCSSQDGEQYLITCLCGETTLGYATGKKIDNFAGLLNGQIFQCEKCMDYPTLTLCSGCDAIVEVQAQSSSLPVNQRRLYPLSGLAMCRTCWAGAMICGVCETPAADAKGKLLPGAGCYPTMQTNYFDYRCRFCNRAPVTHSGSMNPETLAFDIYTWFKKFLGTNGTAQYPLWNFIDSVQLRETTREKENVRTYGCYNINNGRILILQALSPVMFISSLAHEMAHGWQREQNIAKSQTDWRCEGFAVWISYKCLEQMKLSKQDRTEAKLCQAHMQSNEDPDYGGGLRFFLQKEQEAKGNMAVVWKEALMKDKS